MNFRSIVRNSAATPWSRWSSIRSSWKSKSLRHSAFRLSGDLSDLSRQEWPLRVIGVRVLTAVGGMIESFVGGTPERFPPVDQNAVNDDNSRKRSDREGRHAVHRDGCVGGFCLRFRSRWSTETGFRR